MPVITKKLIDQPYGRFVIAEDINEDGAKRFLGFESAREVFPYIETQENKHCHETMIGTNNRKIYFDADKKIDDGIFPEVVDFIDHMRIRLIETLKVLCGLDVAESDICFTDSSTAVKFSMHIIIPSLNTDIESMRNIHKIVSLSMERTNPIYKNILDPNVYKANQNLRLLHCRKMGKTIESTKKLMALSFSPMDTLISYLGNSETIKFTPNIQKIFDARQANKHAGDRINEITKTPELFNAIVMGLSIHRATDFGDWQRVCLALGHENTGLGVAMKFASRAGNFNEAATARLYESGQSYTGRPCTIGTLFHMLKIDNIEEYTRLNTRPDVDTNYFNNGTSADIIKMIEGLAVDECDNDDEPEDEGNDSECDEPDELPDEVRLSGDQKLRRWLNAPEFYLSEPVNKPTTALDDDDTTHIYEDEYMRDYEPEHKTIIIKGNKGVGKTHALVKYIRKFDPDNKKRILFVVFRRSFSNELMKRLEPYGFKNYRDIEGPITDEHNRLVIQVESLPRIKWTQQCDLLVLDEIESIRGQFMSPTCKRRESTIDKYSTLTRTSHQAIIMDADISENTITHIKNTRGGSIHYIENTRHEIQNSFKEYYTTNINKIFAKLGQSLADGRRIIIPTNRSVAYMESLRHTIQTKYPNIKIQMYNSKTIRNEDTAAELINIEESWLKYDVIIYSPTISAGVSFDKVHFDECFCIFVNNGKVNSMRQMTTRVRKFSTNNFYYCLQPFGGSSKPSNLNDYEKYICSNRFTDKPEFIKSIDSYDCSREYPYKDCAYYLWVYNEIEKVRDKNMFLFNFLREQYHSGICNMTWMPDVEPDNVPTITKTEISIMKAELIRNVNEAIATAGPIDDIQKADIIKRLDKEEAITDAERYQLTRRKLLDCYDLGEQPITPEFVAEFNIANIKAGYHNRKLLAAGIENLLIEEDRYFNAVCADDENGPTVCDDLNKHYKGVKMVIAKELINIAGYNDFYDTAEVSKNTIYNNFKNIEETMIKKMPHICDVFGRDKRRRPDIKKWPENTYIRKMLDFINSIISDLFQLKIKQTGHRTGLYNITGIDKYNFG